MIRLVKGDKLKLNYDDAWFYDAYDGDEKIPVTIVKGRHKGDNDKWLWEWTPDASDVLCEIYLAHFEAGHSSFRTQKALENNVEKAWRMYKAA